MSDTSSRNSFLPLPSYYPPSPSRVFLQKHILLIALCFFMLLSVASGGLAVGYLYLGKKPGELLLPRLLISPLWMVLCSLCGFSTIACLISAYFYRKSIRQNQLMRPPRHICFYLFKLVDCCCSTLNSSSRGGSANRAEVFFRLTGSSHSSTVSNTNSV